MSTTNRDLVSQAIAAIPLWRAFLDEKEAEQDALLAEVRAQKKGRFSSLTSRFRRNGNSGENDEQQERNTAPDEESQFAPKALLF